MEYDFDILSERHRRQSEAKAEESLREREESLIRQRRTRGLGRFRRDLRKQERAALAMATSTQQRREIKAKADEIYKSAEFNLDTGYEPRKNKTDAESDIDQRGTDQFTPEERTTDNIEGSGGGGGDADALLEGFEAETLDVVESDNSAGTREFLTKAT